MNLQQMVIRFPAVVLTTAILTLACGCQSAADRMSPVSTGHPIAKTGKSDVVMPVKHIGSDGKKSLIQPIDGRASKTAGSSWPNFLKPFQSSKKRLPLPLTKSIDGEPETTDGTQSF
jgi:hypothetical protein